MQDAPPILNSCIVPNACKKKEIMKIKTKLNRNFPENVGLPPNQRLCLPSLARRHEAHGSSSWISSIKHTWSPS